MASRAATARSISAITKYRCTLALAIMTLISFVHADDDPASAAEHMVRTQIESRGVSDPLVLNAMRNVPRHQFVPASQVDRAYLDTPLPIGHGQTISQPYMVAVMTEYLQPRADMKVLEIGTGSAYQAAVLGQIVSQVYTVEIVEPLARQAADRLKGMGYDNVEVRHADGYFGWPEHGPYDAIIVTAAAQYIPPPLLEQLKPNGRMMIPVGSPFLVQRLMLVEKTAAGKTRSRDVMPVRFVPFTRE